MRKLTVMFALTAHVAIGLASPASADCFNCNVIVAPAHTATAQVPMATITASSL